MSKKTNKKSKAATKKTVKPSKSAANKKVAKEAAPVKATKVAKGGSKKPFVAAICVLSLAAAGLGVGGFFLGKSLAGGNGGGGGGGGGYQPGDKVVTDVNVDNLPAGFYVTARDKAEIGADYDTEIYLNEKDASSNEAPETYVLPDALTKVSYKIGDTAKEIENYTYTVDASAKQAHLFIDKKYVLGQIDIELTLKKVEATSLKIDFETSLVKVLDKDGTPVKSGSAIVVKKNTIALTCNILGDKQDQYKLTKDSFVLSGNPDATIDYNPTTGALSIYNITKSGALLIKAKSLDAILASIIPNHGSVIYEGVTYSEQQIIEVHPDNENKVTFSLELDEGYILTKASERIYCIGEAYYDYDLQADNFTQDPNNPQIYDVTFYNVTGGFSVGFNPIELPSSYVLLSPDSTRYGSFFDEATGVPLPYYSLEGMSGETTVQPKFMRNPGYETMQFQAIKIDNNDIDKLSEAKYVTDMTAGDKVFLGFKNITETTKITITLLEPDTDPELTLDETAQDYITLYDEGAKKLVDKVTLKDIVQKDVKDIFFVCNEESETDISKWKFSINNLLGYYFDSIKDSGIKFDNKTVYTGTLHVRTTPIAWPGYDLELHAVPPVTATAVIAKGAYQNNVVLKYNGVTYSSDKDTPLTVYPNDMGVVEFELHTNDSSIIVEDNITIEGVDRSNWEYDPKPPGSLYIHNVTQGQSFTIKKIDTCAATKKVLLSVPKELTEGVTLFAKQDPQAIITDTPKEFELDVQGGLKIYIVANDDYTIESQCTATYETDKGEIGTIYGIYNGDDTITFPNAKLTTYKSLVISPQTQREVFGDTVYVTPMASEGCHVLEHTQLYLNGKMGNTEVRCSPVKFYAITKIDLQNDVEITVTNKSGTTVLTDLVCDIIPNPDGSDIFDYLITVTGEEQIFKEAGNSVLLLFSNPSK